MPLTPEVKKKVEKLLKRQSFKGDQAALGNELLNIGDKLDEILAILKGQE